MKLRQIKDKTKLVLIKLVHTIIWAGMAAAILYVCYAGACDRIDGLVWFCAGLIVVEGIILLAFRWRCPLTILAEKYTDSHPVGFDIFLPAWLAKNNKTIFSVLFAVGVGLVLWRVL